MNNNNRIYVLTVCWNEEIFLPVFLSYYSFADKIIIFDNFSSDNSINIIKQFRNTEIVKYNTNEQIRDDIYIAIKNNMWKDFKNECDWIIIVDIDEIVFHPIGLKQYLLRLPQNIALIKSNGFEMFFNGNNSYTDNSNFDILGVYNKGVKNSKHCKFNIINTNLVSDINYLPGCHTAFPIYKGIIHNDPNLKMLHYKFIYPLKFLIYRYSLMAKRLSDYNKKNALGFHYSNIQNLVKKYNFLRKKSHNVFSK